VSIRDRINFVPHFRREWDDPALRGTGVANVIHETDKPEHKWITETTARIGEWRSKAHSTYIRWALAINGLLVAEGTYREWSPERRFHVTSLRWRDRHAERVPIAEWTGEEAAKNHAATAELMAAYGVCDLYGCLEEIVFSAYRIFLDHHPHHLLGGPEFKELRTLRKRAKKDPLLASEWAARWAERIETWQRKRAYDGLGAVFLAFMRQAQLQRPHWYKDTTPETWAETISGITELRNLLTHGAATVSPALAEFSKTPYRITFDFEVGEPPNVKLHHLMGIEFFVDQLLTTLNVSLIEHAMGPQPNLRWLLTRPDARGALPRHSEASNKG
jgi:hypothetical protein